MNLFATSHLCMNKKETAAIESTLVVLVQLTGHGLPFLELNVVVYILNQSFREKRIKSKE